MDTPRLTNTEDQEWLQFRQLLLPGTLTVLLVSYLLLSVIVFARIQSMRAGDWLAAILLPPLFSGVLGVLLFSQTFRCWGMRLLFVVAAIIGFAAGLGAILYLAI